LNDESPEKKKITWRLILILGIICLLLILIKFDFISREIEIIVPVIFILLLFIHTVMPRFITSYATMDIKTKKILFSFLGVCIITMEVRTVMNLEVLPWVIKLLPGNLALWKFIYESYLRYVILILFGLFFTVVPWLTMWGARKRISSIALPFLIIFLGMNLVILEWDSSAGIWNLFNSLYGFLSIFIGILFFLIFRNNPKLIENFP